MSTPAERRKNISRRDRLLTLNLGLPPEGVAYFSDGTPFNRLSLREWKKLELSKQIQRNSKHLRQTVRLWQSLCENPVLPSEIYRYYLIFMHIPKAGGTTLQHIIAQNYLPNHIVHANSYQIKKNPACLYHVKRKMRPVVMGHFERSSILYSLLCDRPVVHFTMFREPVQRVLSHYRNLQGNVVDDHSQEGEKMTLAQYASSEMNEIQNRQTLRILGDSSRAAQLQSLNDPDPLFQEAKQVLEHEFSLFGITEQYTPFLIMAQKVLNWENILYRRKNVSIQKPRLDAAKEHSEIDKQALKIIRERNQLDMRLYDFACQLFDKRYQELGIHVNEEKIYKQINQQYDSMLTKLNNN